MKKVTIKHLLMAAVLLAAGGILVLQKGATPSHAAVAAAETSIGKTLARQAVKETAHWNTTDHTKHVQLQQAFTSGRQITEACLSCHSEAEAQFHKTIHWTWLADPADKERNYGKAGYSVNNFCISTNGMNDKGCLACHPGWGTSTTEGVNCLVCHSHSQMNFNEALTDIKAFLAEDDEESKEIAAEIQTELGEAVRDIGLPTRQNCGGCHFKGGGGDGVKHGDLDTSLTKPNKSLDVHMGVDGQNFDCTRCHTTELHRIAGRVYTAPAALERKSLIEDDLIAKITCESCHSATPHESGSKANDHTDKVACQSCHIPEFARVNPTKMSWDWSKAGKLKDGKKYKHEGPFGKHDYMSIKGQFEWKKNVKPEYFWYNGSIKSKIVKDMIDPGKVVKISCPQGDRDDPKARIYPFKVHHSIQPYDKVNSTLLAPMLSGEYGYWETLDWDLALTKGQEALGLPFSGQFDFVPTEYVFPTTHMVAPKENVVACAECHTSDGSRLAALGGFYMPGRDNFNLIDILGWLAALGALAGVTLHGLGRLVFAQRQNNKEE